MNTGVEASNRSAIAGLFKHPAIARLAWAVSGIGILVILWLIFGYRIEPVSYTHLTLPTNREV